MELAVITGCDGGIGRALCELMVRRGHPVLISYLEQNPFEGNEAIGACRLDIRDEGQIQKFVTWVEERLEGRSLGFLVNNAGIARGGPVENVPLALFREAFEVNLFGLVSLTQKLIPRLIASRGRIINIGSMAGRIAPPFLSPYTSSKFALEGFNDSLRRELKPFGIITILIEPAAVATPIWNNSRRQDMSFIDPKYSKSAAAFLEFFVEDGNNGMPVERAGRLILKIMKKKRPACRYIIADNRLLARLRLSIPDTLMDRIFIKLFAMDYGSGENK